MSVRSRSLGGRLDLAQETVRGWIVPMRELAGLVPPASSVLDLGCGQGLLLERVSRKAQRVVGVDYDRRKCELARERLSRSAGGAVEILNQDILEVLRSGQERFPVIILSDTLASVPFGAQEEILRASFERLAPGGVLLVKVIDTEPAWKAFLSRQVSHVVYKVLRLSISEGQRFFHRPARYYADFLDGLGAVTETRPLHRLFFPHVVILARRAAEGSP